MKKILKTKGTVDQWTNIVLIAIDQMGLQSQINGESIDAFYNDQQLMKFQLAQTNGVSITIDYVDERDVDDFKLTAAEIFSHPDKYEIPVQSSTSDDAETVPPESSEKDNSKLLETTQFEIPKSELKGDEMPDDHYIPEQSSDDFENRDFSDLMTPVSQSGKPSKKKKKGKALEIILIILGILALLAAAGFGGYKYMQNKKIPGALLTQAQGYYEAMDYEHAIQAADAIINQYPKAPEKAAAEELKANAQAELEKAAQQQDTVARQQEAQNTLHVTSIICDDPNENGEFNIYIDFVNTSQKEIASIVFGITVVDANGAPLVVEGAEGQIINCPVDGPFAPGTGSSDYALSWGPFVNPNEAKGKLVSLSITYTDGSTYSLGSEAEAAWVVY